MIRLAIGLAVLAAVPSGTPQEKSDFPPFKLVVTAKTGKLVPGDLAPLIQAIKGMKGYAEQKSRERSRMEGEWLEDWKFEIPGDKKFDPTPFWHAFTRYNARRYYLTMTGTLTQEAQTKKLFIHSYSGKSKVKLMNRPKDVFDKDGKAEDLVAKMAKELEEGRPHFTVFGEIFSHGGTLAILLDSYEEAEPPPKPKEEKK